MPSFPPGDQRVRKNLWSHHLRLAEVGCASATGDLDTQGYNIIKLVYVYWKQTVWKRQAAQLGCSRTIG